MLNFGGTAYVISMNWPGSSLVCSVVIRVLNAFGPASFSVDSGHGWAWHRVTTTLLEEPVAGTVDTLKISLCKENP